ncbi:MAG: restriction endonuclease [Melioribacteraceae bacterium]|nr:restriction endonuclease [Melioribacteraceae bacterium]
MNKPKLEDYMLPLLKSFNKNQNLSYKEIIEFITENFDLLQNDELKRSRMMINQCIGYFLKSNIIERIDKGHFKIIDRGVELLNKKLLKIDFPTLREYPEFEQFVQKRNKKPIEDYTPILSEKEIETISIIPEDSIDSLYELYKNNLSDEILEKVQNCTWQFFEILVKDLLVGMGYGDPYDEARITQGSGDGGIDGVIKADVLGLEIICIQAKNWGNTIGRPEIQKFAGSLESKKAKKGVFLTTATFTKEAKEYVKMIEKKIILIDGIKLAELMIDYDIGVSVHKKVILKKIDTDYFE